MHRLRRPNKLGAFVSIPLLMLWSLAAAGENVANLRVPWPPQEKPADSPFAKSPCNSYATYTRDGQQVQPLWGEENPTDFGSRQVQFDFTGIRQLNQIPPPGVHPRIYCTPADLPEIAFRIKTTRCGQEEWKNLLCFVNFMKGTYNARAEYAQLPEGEVSQDKNPTRVPLMREGFGANQAGASACYKALIHGDLSQDPKGLWNVFPLEAFRCWIENDASAAHELALAVTTALKIEQAKREVTRKNKNEPLEQPIAGIQLAYTYDFLFNFLSADQKKTLHDELANGTWSHDNYGTFNDATNSRSNWATFSYWLIEVLSIEGEPGFNDLKVRGIYRGWRNLFTYGWFESGATYEGEAKNQLGMDGVLALAIRAQAYGFDNLAAHPYVRAYATSFLPKSVIPTRDGFVKYDLLGGCHGTPLPADLIGLKFLIPDDKIIDWVYRCSVGEHYERLPNRSEAGGYDPTVWGSYFDQLIPFLIFASDFDPANNDPSRLGVGNTFFCGERALMMTRSSWSKDAMMLNLHVRQANGGHPFADRNAIMVAGAGRVWSPIDGWGYQAWQNVNNSDVVIDDHAQADVSNEGFHTPARMVDFVDEPQATFAVGDGKYAWDWNWRPDQPRGKQGTFTLEDFKAKTITVLPDWELENHTVDDFSYLKLNYAYLNQPLSRQPDWLKMEGCISPMLRQPDYPVQRAFRTAGLVRGTHPYALVIDDIQKDDQPHDYTWYMTVEYDVQIAKIDKPNDHEIDLVLTGADPAQKFAPGASGSPSPPLPAKLGDTAQIPAGQPMLLVRFLNYRNTEPEKIATEAKEPTILEDAPPASPKGHYLQRVRRLAVPVRAVSPEFKVLLYAYHQGDGIPATSWAGANQVKVSWPDQTDQITFSTGSSGKTNVTVTRGAEVLARVDKAVSPLGSPN